MTVAATPNPERLTYVVGDIHGRDDLLDKLLAMIRADRYVLGLAADLVFVGDYIDRGDCSRQVLERLMSLAPLSGGRLVCLLGNHEQMFLSYLQGSAADGSVWLKNGGREMLQSFGVRIPLRLAGPIAVERLREEALSVIPQRIIDWIAARPTLWSSGDLVVVHAAFDPALPVDQQDENLLIWGRPPEFLRKVRETGPWVVHGHTITRPAAVSGRRIPIDTGAFSSGVLTAAVIAPHRPVRFLAT